MSGWICFRTEEEWSCEIFSLSTPSCSVVVGCQGVVLCFRTAASVSSIKSVTDPGSSPKVQFYLRVLNSLPIGCEKRIGDGLGVWHLLETVYVSAWTKSSHYKEYHRLALIANFEKLVRAFLIPFFSIRANKTLIAIRTRRWKEGRSCLSNIVLCSQHAPSYLLRT